jgi:ribose/xylose/arabinose/galactoside ABC-type transport system permease subunit
VVAEQGRASASPGYLRSLYVRLGIVPLLIVLAIAIFTIGNPRFFSLANFMNVLQQSTFLMLIAFGQMFVLISGGFDLSVGTNVALTSIVSSTAVVWMLQIYPDAEVLAVFFGLMVAIGVGVVAGSINATGISLLKVNPFITTLASASVFQGLTLLLSRGMQVGGLPDLLIYDIGSGTIFGVPVVVLVTIPISVVAYLALSRARFGRYVFAVGSNSRAAAIAGVNVRRILFLTYVICAVLASFSGFMLTARVSAGQPLLGAEFPLMSITAAIIGGCSLQGGKGSVVGTVLGVLFVTIISNGMNLMRLDSYYQMIVLGIVLMGAVVLDQYRSKHRT